MHQSYTKKPEQNKCIHAWYVAEDEVLDKGSRFRLYLLMGETEGLATSECALAGPGVMPSLNGLCPLLDITSA